MSFSRIMKRAVRRVADVLGAHAREQGWWPLDFRLYYRTNEKWGKLDFLFVSDGFEGRDEHEVYISIKNYLNRWLDDEQELIESVGFAFQTFKQTDQGGLYSIPESFDLVRARDLVARSLNEVANLIVKYAKDRDWADKDYLVFYRLDPVNRAKIQIVVALPSQVGYEEPYGCSLVDYIHTRLFDEPNLIRTFELKVRPSLSRSEAADLKKSQYTEFFTMPRSLIS